MKSDITITETYNGYTPPKDTAKIVRRLIDFLPEQYTLGLRTVVITHSGNLSRKRRKRKNWSRNKKTRVSKALAVYHQSWNSQPAWIEIFIDNILDSHPKQLLWIPFYKNAVLADIFFHEVGHHIHHTVRPEHNDKEDVADAWGKKLRKSFLREKYLIWSPLLLPLFLIVVIWKFCLEIYTKIEDMSNKRQEIK